MVSEKLPMKRSQIMKRVKSKNTNPELVVRIKLCALGFKGYRLHRKELPGCPDIAFLSRRKVIFVHGCFWHGHDCKHGRRQPKTNTNYWVPKIERNKIRDSENILKLIQSNWSVLILWECEISDKFLLEEKLMNFLAGQTIF